MTILQMSLILFLFHFALNVPGNPVREPSRRSRR